MELLQSHETRLEGKWLIEDGQSAPDETQQRIKWLVNTQLSTAGLRPGRWEVLYHDERDGRFWELSFPQAEGQNGAWMLTCVPAAYAARFYSIG